MSETQDDQDAECERGADSPTISVLYVALDTKNPSTPAALETAYEMDVRVSTSLSRALDQVTAGGFDCLVAESTDSVIDRALIEEGATQPPGCPVVIYADAGESPGFYREYISNGRVDYLSRATDTDDRLLLAQRIKQCTALQHEYNTPRNFEAAIDRAGHSVLIANTDGEIEYVNSAFEDVGYAREALEGEPLSTLRTDIVDEATASDLWETVKNGERWSGELTVDTPAGTRDIDLTATPLQTEDGEIEQFVAVGNDITRHKQRERRLRSFREAVEQAGHIIMITDTDGYIEYVNPAFEEVTGYDREEALGERPSILKSGEHRDNFYEDLWATICSGNVWEGELINERKNGERYHIRQTIAPVTDEDGQIERFVAVNTDITDKKRHEQQLQRERDRLEEFARTVAHDLRNPLSIASGHVELAQAEASPADETLDRAVDALERMDAVIDEVLALSKDGQTIYQPETLRLAEVAQRAWGLVETANATLRIEDDLENRVIKADESRLCELFENHYRNAIEHGSPRTPNDPVDDTDKSGEATRQFDPDGSGTDLTVSVGRLPDRQGFYIADDGSGIPQSNRNQIFEGGFTTTDDGTGFGLTIVKQIVDAHGWEIDVVESEDGGARFEITTDTELEHRSDEET